MSDFSLTPDYTFETTKEYKTIISEFENGAEQRRGKWSSQKRTWKLQYKNRDSTDLSTVTTLFDNKMGSLASFTWTNPLDSQDYTVRFKEDSVKYGTDSFGLYDFEFELTEIK